MSKPDDQFCWKDGVTLKDYFDQRLSDLEEKIDVIFELNKTAIDKSEAKLDIRLEAMNEFRAQLNRQAGTFLTKDFFEAKHSSLQQQIDTLRLNEATLAGKASQTSLIVVTLLSVAGLTISLISLIIKIIGN
jgi:hypothetical protein